MKKEFIPVTSTGIQKARKSGVRMLKLGVRIQNIEVIIFPPYYTPAS